MTTDGALDLGRVAVRHVLAAIRRIDREGVPKGRAATKFTLHVDGQTYPPKYALCLAYGEATGRELHPNELSGGQETNNRLRVLGFHITPVSGKTAMRPAAPKLPARTLSPEPQARRSQPVPTTLIARCVVAGRPAATPKESAGILVRALRDPKLERPVRFLITPGGFVTVPFPKAWRGQTGWSSRRRDFEGLLPHAQRALQALLASRVLRELKAKTRILTVGVDLIDEGVSTRHAELVAVVDVANGSVIRWTGKSYPVARQERKLVHVVDLESHFLKLAGERVLVLGCHDLNMFSPRGWANMRADSPRRQRCRTMRKLAAQFRPTVVLQHPHSTDSPNIWRVAWSGLQRTCPSVAAWASGIGYFNPHGRPRRPLARVLADTKSTAVAAEIVDVVTRR